MSTPDDPAPEWTDEKRADRFVDTDADHVKVGPKTAEALKIPKTLEELDAMIPLAEEPSAPASD